jgi:hypothetical protein
MVAMQVLAKSVGSAGRQRGELGQRLGRLRRIVQVAPTDAGNRVRLGMTVARNSASSSSKAKASSASVGNASMASRRPRKLAVSSTR